MGIKNWIKVGVFLFLSFSGLFGLWDKEIPSVLLFPFPLLASLAIFTERKLFTFLLALSFNYIGVRLGGGTQGVFFFSYLVPIALGAYFFEIKNYGLGISYVIVIEIITSLIRNASFLNSVFLFLLFSLTIGFVVYGEKRRRGVLEKKFLREKAKKKFLDPIYSKIQERIAVLRQEIYSTDIEDFVEKMLYVIQTIINPHTVTFWGVCEGKARLIKGVSKSIYFNENAEIEIGKGITGWAIKEKKDVFINDYYENSMLLGYYKRDTFVKSVGIVCMRDKKEIRGLLVADYIEREEFTPERKEFLKKMAVLFEEFIKISKLFEERQQDALRFSALYEFSGIIFSKIKREEVYRDFVNLLSGIFSGDGAGIGEIINSKGKIVKTAGNVLVKENYIFNLDKGIVSTVIKHGGFLLNPDIKRQGIVVFDENEPRPFNRSLLVSVYEAEELKGVIWVEKREKNYFKTRDGKIAEFLGRILSTALLRVKYAEKLQALATQDSLTGLLNHRAFQETLNELLKKEKNLVLLMIDIDHFKKINDTYGHPFGDSVLKEIGTMLKKKEVIAARYGGEEFAVVLPGLLKKQGVMVAQKLLEDIRNLRFSGKENLVITASIGVASYPSDAKDKSSLISKADELLYQAKKEGRNRACWGKEMLNIL